CNDTQRARRRQIEHAELLDIDLAFQGPPGLETLQAGWDPAHSPGITPMPTLALASEPTRATVSSPSPLCARGSPLSSLQRQRPLWVPHVSKSPTRQSSATTALSRIPREGQGVVRQSAGSADERVTEVLGICGLAGGRRPRLLTAFLDGKPAGGGDAEVRCEGVDSAVGTHRILPCSL